MEKLNIAEILRHCPKGMELDCTMYDNVTFEGIKDVGYINILIKTPNGIFELSKNGCYHFHPNAKCVIFPKGKTTWEGFQRPFKDGDILAYQYPSFTNPSIYIHKYSPGLNTAFHVALSGDGDFKVSDNYRKALYGNDSSARFATEEEKEKLFDAIKENGYKWNPETKTLEKVEVNKFDITTLKPFESRVLVRSSNDDIWKPAIWGIYNDIYCSAYPYITTYGAVCQCIPYEGNQHLLGTTDNCDEYFKTWE